MTDEKIVTKADFEDELQRLYESIEFPAALQMLSLMKFASDKGIFTEEDYSKWRVKAKSL